MTRTREMNAQDITDIEEGIIKAKCFCGHVQHKYRKMMFGTDEDGRVSLRKTKNFIGVCTNPQCPKYSKVEKLKTWVLEEKVIKA